MSISCFSGVNLGKMRRILGISQLSLIKLLIKNKPYRKYESCFNQVSLSKLERGKTYLWEDAQQFLPLIEDLTELYIGMGFDADAFGGIIHVQVDARIGLPTA